MHLSPKAMHPVFSGRRGHLHPLIIYITQHIPLLPLLDVDIWGLALSSQA